jgi:FKBP-type peptidyl-prolyl cis-trans isomerase (trigger factor)
MKQELRLKSRVLDVYDYHNMDVTGYIPPYEPDEAQLEKDLLRCRRAHGRAEAASAVAEGDTVVLSCRANAPKFNKEQLTVLVGQGLYSRELEAQLVGMAQGASATLTAEGAAVTVTIHAIRRTVLPELTDQQVASWGLEGVQTVAQLRHACIDRQIDRFLDEDESADQAVACVSQQVVERSTFVMDEEECSHALAEAEQKLAELQQAEQGVPDGFSGEKMADFLRRMNLNALKIAVLGGHLRQQAQGLLTEADYQAALRKRPSYREDDPAQAQAEYPVEAFLKDQYADYYINALDAYVAAEFKKVMNPYV